FTSFEMGKTEATNLDPGDDQVWSLPELSVSGEYIRARIKGISYMPIDRTPKQAYTTTIWDFNDGTTQKFAVNSGSPNQSIVTANANNTLKVSGLAVDPGNYWGNRISADGVGVDITGAEKMTMDVITDAPATVNIGVVAQGPANGYWTSPTRAAQAIPGNFVKQDDGKYKATLTVTKDDAPGLNLIGSNSDPKLTGVVLLIGSSTDAIYLDNIAVSGNRAVVEPPVIHDPLGTPTLPSDFEDSTRQGWNWSGDSGVKTALTIKDANGSKALSWEYSYPDVKPTDNWASAPRLDFWMDNLVLGDNKYVTFDLYMSPVRVSKGAIDINLVFQPPTLGYWAQAQKTYKIQLDNLSTAEKTADGLYHFMVTLDASSVPNIAPDTMLRNMMFIFADVDSDFAGRMYVDNVKFQKEYTVNVGTLTGGTITADPAAGIAGTTVNLTVTPDVGYKLKDGSLKYNDGAKDTAITGTSFIMPAANVTVSAVFEKIFYAVKIGALTNGKITASTSSAVMGTTVNLTVAPARGYRLKAGTLKYNDGIQDVAINGTSFVMPAANVTVTAEFERDIYKVSVASTAGGTIIAFPAWVEPGQTVFVIVVPNKGYHMKPGSLMYNNGTRDVSIKGFYFRMPASNVTITAQFVRGNGK
ncbi:MAG: carbohydrate-binding domain-containing protein, partial [Bacillota bacterium]|nr:carbohydrate-binding domain-containing protein [Bacillota bacterium]